ncbi:MAG TPA: hypothetical protein PK587_03875 [Syntrophales bacterium]|nr:hypothetical protein [Syntrophales bacterium]
MSNLMPKDIMVDVESVLRAVQVDPKGRGRAYLTAYQILEQLPQPMKDQLIRERGTPGMGAGRPYAAASVVSDAAEKIPGIEIVFLETSSIKILLNETDITPGNKYVGLYRL